MRKIAVFTSGGDAPGMNACIRAVVRTALSNGLEVVGIRRGYQGMIENDMIPMGAYEVSNIIQLGGTILRSARSVDFRSPEGRQRAYENLHRQGVEGVVVIGGDGSFRGAQSFMADFPDIPFVGCPGTIDNDLFGTDYTIGYDTAINTAMQAIDNIKDTANAHDRLFFIEVMGRDAGFIALQTGIATGAEAVLIPERGTTIEELIQTLEWCRERKKNSSIVIVAEGEEMGGAYKVAERVGERFHDYEIKVTILGHLQRGGRPTCMDRVRASRMGAGAVEALREGTHGVMVGIINDEIAYTPFERAVKEHNVVNPKLLEMVNLLR